MTGLAQDTHRALPAHYTHTMLASLMRNAKTTADYKVLCDYFNRAAELDRAKAAEEKTEWDRRGTNVALSAAKYPRPVDSAHYLYVLYLQDAERSKMLAQKYGQLAEGSTSR
jgi:hypothetical protein